MENKAHALAAGAFVIFITALVVALAAWLAHDNRARSKYELTTRESVMGLSPQSAVKFRGVNVGKVDAIEFDPLTKGNVLVKLMIDSSAPITKSTYATLGTQGVTGLAFVQLDDGGESSEPLTTSSADIARIPVRQSLLGKLTDKGADILVQVEATTKRLNQLLSDDNQKAIIGALQAASASAAQVGSMAQRMQTIADAQLGPQRTNIPAMVQETTATMRALQNTSTEINKTAAEATRAVTAVNAAVQGPLTGALANTQKTLDKINSAGGVLDQVGQGTAALSAAAQTLNASTLPRASRAVDDAARTLRQVDRTVGAIGDNPQSMIFGNGITPPGPGEPGFVAPASR